MNQTGIGIQLIQRHYPLHQLHIQAYSIWYFYPPTQGQCYLTLRITWEPMFQHVAVRPDLRGNAMAAVHAMSTTTLMSYGTE